MGIKSRTKTCREAEVIAQEQSLGDLKESLQEEDLGKLEDGGSLNKLALDDKNCDVLVKEMKLKLKMV
jgi:hypothetical protein